MSSDVKSLIHEGAELTDRALEALLPSASTVPASIHGAMRHSTFAGGKRLRPVLAMQAAITIAGSLPKGIERLGAALEMLHTYSLIHDDLPALDNDDLRRGKPTCHVAFGEAIAIQLKFSCTHPAEPHWLNPATPEMFTSGRFLRADGPRCTPALARFGPA